MRLRWIPLALAISGAVASPAQAVIVNLNFVSEWSIGPDDVRVLGSGSFTAADQPALTLGDVTGFTFAWQVLGLGAGPSPFFTAGLGDLVAFSADLSGGTVTGLALQTKLIASPTPAIWAPELFSVSGLAQDQAFTSTNAMPNPSGVGVGIVTATLATGPVDPIAVPAPAALALFGLGCVGLGLTRVARRNGQSLPA